MRVLVDGTIKDIELFGQLSQTGIAFDKGYYIGLSTGSYFFADGEEEQRDKFLTDNKVFDDESPTWDDLYEYDDNAFYYSEWYVEDDMDGGYSADGTYYLYDEDRELFIEE